MTGKWLNLMCDKVMGDNVTECVIKWPILMGDKVLGDKIIDSDVW